MNALRRPSRTDSSQPIKAQEVRKELDRLVNSPIFAGKDKPLQFLRYIVNETLAGRTRSLNALNIGIGCFGKSPSEDLTEGYVRNIASKTRKLIKTHYLSRANAGVEIELPKGGYQPLFHPGAADTRQPAALQPTAFTPPMGDARSPNPTPAVIPTLAIVPLSCRSGGQQDRVIGDLVATQLVEHFSSSSRLRLLSNRSTAIFRDTGLPSATVGDRLGANFLVLGDYRASARSLKVQLKLVEVASDETIWHTEDAFPLDALLQGQEWPHQRWASDISHALMIQVAQPAMRLPIESLDHLSLLLGGVHCTHAREPALFERAFSLLSELSERLPGHPAPFAALARWHLVAMFRGGASQDMSAHRKAISALAGTAIRNDANDPEARIALTYKAQHVDHSLEKAERLIDEAVFRSPNHSLALGQQSGIKNLVGDADAGLASAERAIATSPYDPELYFFLAAAGVASQVMGDYTQAIERANQSLTLNPNHAAPVRTLIACFAHMKDRASAKAAGRRLLSLEPDFTISRYCQDHPFAKTPQGEHWPSSLAFAGIPNE